MITEKIDKVNRKRRGRPTKEKPLRNEALPNFTTSAKIDTIVLSIQLSKFIAPSVLQRKIAGLTGFCSSAVAVTLYPGEVIAEVRIQDPTPAGLRRFHTLFAASIDRLDIAVDHRPADPADLDQLAAQLARYHLPHPDIIAMPGGRVRQCWGGKGKVASLGADLDSLVPGWTTYAGQRGGPILWRSYAKRQDNGQKLPPEQWVARVEAEIRRPELRRRGIETLPDLFAADFGQFADLFRFAQIAQPAKSCIGWSCIDQARKKIATNHADLGTWSVPAGRRIAFDRLNRAARRALDRLADQFDQPFFLDTDQPKDSRESAPVEESPYNSKNKLDNSSPFSPSQDQREEREKEIHSHKEQKSFKSLKPDHEKESMIPESAHESSFEIMIDQETGEFRKGSSNDFAFSSEIEQETQEFEMELEIDIETGEFETSHSIKKFSELFLTHRPRPKPTKIHNLCKMLVAHFCIRRATKIRWKKSALIFGPTRLFARRLHKRPSPGYQIPSLSHFKARWEDFLLWLPPVPPPEGKRLQRALKRILGQNSFQGAGGLIEACQIGRPG